MQIVKTFILALGHGISSAVTAWLLLHALMIVDNCSEAEPTLLTTQDDSSVVFLTERRYFVELLSMSWSKKTGDDFAILH